MTQQTPVAHSPANLLENMFASEMSFMRSGAEDASLLATAFHAEAVIHEPTSLPYAGEWKGLDGVAQLLRRMRDAFSEMRVANLHCAQLDDAVFVSCTLHMTSRETGIALSQPFAEVLRFEDGLLREGTPFYWDTAEIAAALRSAEATKP